jgi:tetratricopeptide (TPR) repeat protein
MANLGPKVASRCGAAVLSLSLLLTPVARAAEEEARDWLPKSDDREDFSRLGELINNQSNALADAFVADALLRCGQVKDARIFRLMANRQLSLLKPFVRRAKPSARSEKEHLQALRTAARNGDPLPPADPKLDLIGCAASCAAGMNGIANGDFAVADAMTASALDKLARFGDAQIHSVLPALANIDELLQSRYFACDFPVQSVDGNKEGTLLSQGMLLESRAPAPVHSFNWQSASSLSALTARQIGFSASTRRALASEQAKVAVDGRQLAWLYKVAHEYEKSEHWLRRMMPYCLQHVADNPRVLRDLFYELGELRLFQSDKADALQFYRAALDVDLLYPATAPETYWLLDRLAQTCVGLGRFEEAEAYSKLALARCCSESMMGAPSPSPVVVAGASGTDAVKQDAGGMKDVVAKQDEGGKNAVAVKQDAGGTKNVVGKQDAGDKPDFSKLSINDLLSLHELESALASKSAPEVRGSLQTLMDQCWRSESYDQVRCILEFLLGKSASASGPLEIERLAVSSGSSSKRGPEEKNRMLLVQLGYLHLYDGDFQAGIDCFTKVLTAKQNTLRDKADYYAVRGQLADDLGMDKQAQGDFHRAIRLYKVYCRNKNLEYGDLEWVSGCMDSLTWQNYIKQHFGKRDDYLKAIDRHRWQKPEVKVFVSEDGDKGFDAPTANKLYSLFEIWAKVTNGRLKCIRVPDYEAADITVERAGDNSIVANGSGGRTTFEYQFEAPQAFADGHASNGDGRVGEEQDRPGKRQGREPRTVVAKAHINVICRTPSASELSPIGAEKLFSLTLHEAGHALGLDGHSPNGKDVMYWKSAATALTEHDIASLSHLYAGRE